MYSQAQPAPLIPHAIPTDAATATRMIKDRIAALPDSPFWRFVATFNLSMTGVRAPDFKDHRATANLASHAYYIQAYVCQALCRPRAASDRCANCVADNGPFETCRSWVSLGQADPFGGACANCRWGNKTCSWRDSHTLQHFLKLPFSHRPDVLTLEGVDSIIDGLENALAAAKARRSTIAKVDGRYKDRIDAAEAAGNNAELSRLQDRAVDRIAKAPEGFDWPWEPVPTTGGSNWESLDGL